MFEFRSHHQASEAGFRDPVIKTGTAEGVILPLRPRGASRFSIRERVFLATHAIFSAFYTENAGFPRDATTGVIRGLRCRAMR